MATLASAVRTSFRAATASSSALPRAGIFSERRVFALILARAASASASFVVGIFPFGIPPRSRDIRGRILGLGRETCASGPGYETRRLSGGDPSAEFSPESCSESGRLGTPWESMSLSFLVRRRR